LPALEKALGTLVVAAALLRRRPAPRLPAGVDAEDLAAGYERSDANIGGIVGATVALLLALTVVLVAVTWFAARSTGLPVSIGRPADLVGGTTGAPTPPPPRLEAQSGTEMAAYRNAAEERLTTYGWVDRASGTVHIPIDQAKALVVQRGSNTSGTASAAQTTLPSDASSGRAGGAGRP
jgi:hypothetical protein